ncbi:hypothetical protein CPB85DRAFT_1428238 [Mucidula mucida]|nr:hypothetical protein CPB85DRAFT_1428238 [Mucidula mucida]
MTSEGDTSHVRRPKFRFEEALRSITIAQAKLATQEHDKAKVFLQGHRAERVQIVANLFEIEDRPTYRMYLLMDGTAEIKARVFGKDSDNDTSYSDTILDIEPDDMEILGERPFVHVVGELSVFYPIPGNRTRKSVALDVQYIRLVDDAHEMDRHFLDCIMEYWILQKNEYPPTVGGSQEMVPQSQAVTMDVDEDHSMEEVTTNFAGTSLSPGPVHEMIEESPPRRRPSPPILDSPSHSLSRSNHTAPTRARRPDTPIMIDLTLDSDGEEEAGTGLTHDRSAAKSSSVQNTPKKNKMKTPKKTKTPRKADPLSGLSTLQRDLIRHLQEETGVGRIYPRLSGSQPSSSPVIAGLSKEDIVRAFRREQYRRSDIEDALSSLLHNGYIYTTIDKEHFNVTDQ